MDVVLEVFDTFFFDRIYANVLPSTSLNFPNKPIISSSSSSVTSTFSSVREVPTAIPRTNQYFHFEPSQYAYMSQLSRDNIWRQGISLYLITWLFGAVVYFLFATASYLFVFNGPLTFSHPRYLRHQIRLEILQTLRALPIMAIFTAPCFLGEVRGYAKLYDHTSEAPFWLYNILQFPLFLMFTDFFIYWIHRGLHSKMLYKRLHKPHHKWVVPTPFASHAFHPLDGFAQSVPYHVYPYLFPLQKFAYLGLFIFINMWTISIHDGEYIANSAIINGAACHGIHHEKFEYNYGQFTTLWDRLAGSYRRPADVVFSKDKDVAGVDVDEMKKGL